MVKIEDKSKEDNKFNIKVFIIKKFNLLVLATIILTLVVDYIFFIKGIRAEVSTMYENVIKPVEEDLALKKDVDQKLKEQTKNFEIIKNQRLETLSEILPYNNNQEDLFLILHKLAEEEGLAVKSINLGRKAPLSTYINKGIGKIFKDELSSIETPVVVIPISMEVYDKNGNIGYSKIKSLLNSLLVNSRIFSVSGLEIGGVLKGADLSQREEGGSFKLNFDVFMLDSGFAEEDTN